MEQANESGAGVQLSPGTHKSGGTQSRISSEKSFGLDDFSVDSLNQRLEENEFTLSRNMIP